MSRPRRVCPIAPSACPGGLTPCGVDLVDRAVRGASPKDLPIEEPTRYLLVVNMKTANALGLQIPKAVLARADRVIE